MSFKSLGLSNILLELLNNQNYKKPYPIQEKAIPAILSKKDVLAIAPTGSGKTASFVLPILMQLQNIIETKNRHIDVLVLVPTRELAVQVESVFRTFSYNLPKRVKSLAVYGGVSINPQMMGMQNVNVLVATPGRLLDLIESKAVHLSAIKTLVLDEADKMLNMGFKEEMDKILQMLPNKRQNLLFSATLSTDLSNFNQVLLDSPVIIEVEGPKDELELIKQTAYLVEDSLKGPLLRYLIKKNGTEQFLIFTSSTYKADNVAEKLRKNGIDAVAIHGKKSQSARSKALSQFKSGKLKILVATDLLSRGIDIEYLPNVINYELPRSPKEEQVDRNPLVKQSHLLQKMIKIILESSRKK